MITVDEARSMHVADLRRLAANGDEVAARQASLRDAGTSRVLGALAALGLRYSGTSGWWITAYAAPMGAEWKLGFVNIAKGIGVETDVPLAGDIVEALTIPSQGDGPVASGAAAWTSPDAGEGHAAAAPEGWIQLLVDVRESVAGAGVGVVECRARVTRWGLRTCYKDAGAPGYQELDPKPTSKKPYFDEMDPRDWPCSHETKQATRDLAETRLRAWTIELARKGGIDGVAEGLEASVAKALDATRCYVWRSRDSMSQAEHECRMALNLACNDVVRDALREAGVERVSRLERSDVSGGRLYDVIARCLERLIIEKSTPIVEVFLAQLTPLMENPTTGWSPMWASRVSSTIKAIARPIAAQALRHVDAREAEKEIVAAYYGGQPAVVDIPIAPR